MLIRNTKSKINHENKGLVNILYAVCFAGLVGFGMKTRRKLWSGVYYGARCAALRFDATQD